MIYFKNDYNKPENKIDFNFKKYVIYASLILFLIFIYIALKSSFFDITKMFNTSKIYHNTYIQKVQEKQGFYDKLWKTYLQKEKITNVNRETFIEVSKIIMENRRDGQKVTWKWLQENQQISYSEFTKFYSDLSTFIESQRDAYFSIEKVCQEIANKNNTMLDTFPNNIYNRLLQCKRIDFEYGFLSDSTNKVFTNKKENLK